MPPHANYAAYLLRLREVQDGDRVAWIATVQSTATGEQRSFASMNAFVAFLQAEYGEGRVPAGPPSADRAGSPDA